MIAILETLNETTTFSPWIFYELATLHTLRVRMPSFDCGLEKLASGGKIIRAFSESKQPKITLPVHIENLYKLTYDDINSHGNSDIISFDEVNYKSVLSGLFCVRSVPTSSNNFF